MSGARLTADFRVKALIRRVHDAGGSAMVLRRGEATSGGVLVVVEDWGGGTKLFERGIGPEGESALIRTGPREDSAESIEDYWRRRAARDPDLWIVEISVVEAERFAAETIAAG